MLHFVVAVAVEKFCSFSFEVWWVSSLTCSINVLSMSCLYLQSHFIFLWEILLNHISSVMKHLAHSPYLAPTDYYLFPNPKKLLLGRKCSSTEETTLAVHACQTAHNYSGISEWTWWSTMDVSRYALNHIEDILKTYYKCTLSSITHKLNISGHILILTIFHNFPHLPTIAYVMPWLSNCSLIYHMKARLTHPIPYISVT
jgi:hypothetical protein